jgi:hypothetical protein
MSQSLAFLTLVTILALTLALIFGILFGIISIGEFLTKKRAVFVRQISEENNVYSVYKYGNIFFKKTLYLAENKKDRFDEKSVYNTDGSIADDNESEAIRKQNKPPPVVLQSITKAEDNYHGRQSRY